MSSKGFVNQFKNTRRQARVDRMKPAKQGAFPFRKKGPLSDQPLKKKNRRSGS